MELHRARVSRVFAAVTTLLIAAAAHATLVGGVRLALLPQQWRDDAGRSLALSELGGSRVVLTMAYASCHRICPMTIDSLKRLQADYDARGERAEFVIVGYDPANEDPAAWHQYRRSHHLNQPNWHFLTGTVADTTRLARQLNFELWKYDEHVMHDSRVLVFSQDGVLAEEILPGTADTSAAP